MPSLLGCKARSVGLAAVLLSTVSGAGVVHACPPGTCAQLPLPGTSVPANAFAAEIADPAQSQPSLVDIAGGSVALVTNPISDGVWLARPAQPLVPGVRYTFRRYDPVQVTTASRAVECQQAPYPVSRDFVALASAPYPTTLGTVTVLTPYADDASPAGGTTVGLTLSDEALPFAGLLRVSVLVDGLPLAYLADQPVELGASVTVNVICATDGPSESLSLNGCGDVLGLGPGPHGLVFSGRIPGAPSAIASDPVVVTATCGSRAPVYPGDDMATPNGGCSLAGARPTGMAWVLVALGLGLTALRRARRA